MHKEAGMAHYVVIVQVKRVDDAPSQRTGVLETKRAEPVDLTTFTTKGKEIGETITAAKGHLDLVTDF